VKLVALHHVLLVGTGGFIGAVLRYWVSGLVQRLDPLLAFPYGTLVVNGVGSLLIGVLAGLAESRNVLGTDLRTFLLIGVLGAFTTFSTFSYETLALLRDGEHLKAGANVIGTVLLCLVAVWIGFGLATVR
jgi:CrcB protein